MCVLCMRETNISDPNFDFAAYMICVVRRNRLSNVFSKNKFNHLPSSHGQWNVESVWLNLQKICDGGLEIKLLKNKLKLKNEKENLGNLEN